MGQVQGKVAIVTGGASGIGAASAETLAHEGATVVVADIDEAGGEAVVRRIAGAGGQAVFLRHDVTNEARWVEVVAEVERRYGRLDVLFSNAGIAILGSLFEMSLDDWRRLDHHHLIGCWVARNRWPCRLLRHQGRRAPVRQSRGDGVRRNEGQHPDQHDPSRRYRYANYDEDDRRRGRWTLEHEAGPPRDGRDHTAGPSGKAAGHRQCRPLPRLGRIELHDSVRDRRRRWLHGRQPAASGLGATRRLSAAALSGFLPG